MHRLWVRALYTFRTVILAQLEQGPLYNAINFSYLYSPYGTGDISGIPINSTVAGTLVKVFVCPSDLESQPSGYAGAGNSGIGVPDSNYLASAGITVTGYATWVTPCTTAGATEGAIHEFQTVRFSGITDGLSNTLLLGEIARGPNGPGQANWFAAFGERVQRVASVGINQRLSCPSSLCPLCDIPETANAPLNGPQSYLGFGSYHPGGANFAFGDGSVRLLKSTTDRRVLSALGTRAGGEAVSASDY